MSQQTTSAMMSLVIKMIHNVKQTDKVNKLAINLWVMLNSQE